MQRTLSTSDVCAVSGYSRNQVGNLLRLIPPYSDAPTNARFARPFNPVDLTVICILYRLETSCAVRRKDLGDVSALLLKELKAPRQATSDAVLVISFTPPCTTYFETMPTVCEGIVLRLGPIVESVDSFLLGKPHELGSQVALDFEPMIMSAKTKRNSSI